MLHNHVRYRVPAAGGDGSKRRAAACACCTLSMTAARAAVAAASEGCMFMFLCLVYTLPTHPLMPGVSPAAQASQCPKVSQLAGHLTEVRAGQMSHSGCHIVRRRVVVSEVVAKAQRITRFLLPAHSGFCVSVVLALVACEMG